MAWALVFDVDGVIVETEILNAKATVEMFRRLYGAIVQPGDFQPFIGTGDERYVEGVAEKYGVTIDTQAAVLERERCFFELLATEPLPAAPGVAELVRAARERADLRLAIATSGNRSKQVQVIEGAGLKLEWFDVVITGDMVARKKPDPLIYRLAVESLGLPPGHCMVIEDAPSGVKAAKAAGCLCVAVMSSVGAEQLAGADVIVQSLEEVSLARLEELL